MRSIAENTVPKEKCRYSNELDHDGAVLIDGVMITGGIALTMVIVGVISRFVFMPAYCCAVLAIIAILAIMPKIVRIIYLRTLPKLAPTAEIHEIARKDMILSFLFMAATFASYVALVVAIIASPAFYCTFWIKLAIILQAVNVMRNFVTAITIFAVAKKKKLRIIGWE